MRGWTIVAGPPAPLTRGDIDTDQIAPARFLTTISPTGYERVLFHDWRFLPDGREDPDFVLNHDAWRSTPILIAGPNFGCGSSREHAVWALRDYGIRAILAPSFNSLFFANCVANGLLPACLDDQVVRRWGESACRSPKDNAVIDLTLGSITYQQETYAVELPPSDIDRIRTGQDAIDVALAHVEAIRTHEASRPGWFPTTEALFGS